MYSSMLTTDSPMYSRVGCDGLDSYYEAIEVKIFQSGCYSFDRNSSVLTYGYIYKDNFNPVNPFANLISEDDGNLNYNQFKLTIHLQANIKYMLVIVMDSSSEMGNFSTIVSAPNNVGFEHLSEYLYYFVNK